MKWFERYREWEGTAAELASAAHEIAQSLEIEDRLGVVPNERLVRHYVQQGILDRPRRQGREALFGARQLAQFLAARLLAEENWPLSQIARFTASAETETLLELIPSPIGEEMIRFSLACGPLPEASEMPTASLEPAVPLRWIEYQPLPWCRLLLREAEAGELDTRMLGELHRAVDRVLSVAPQDTGLGPVQPVAGKLALICDDRSIDAWLREHLQDLGYTVFHVRSTEEALALLDRLRFDVVITDLGREKQGRHERLEGLRLVRAIRARGLKVPIAIYSMGLDAALCKLAREAGAELVTEQVSPLKEWLDSLEARTWDR